MQSRYGEYLPMDYYLVTFLLPNHVRRDGVFRFDDDATDCTLTLQFNGRETSVTADDYFDALCALRQPIEADGIRLHCYGASRHVYPSGMGRAMGRGLQAFKMTLGQPANQADLVSLFATGPDVHFATVEEQRAYFDTWLKRFGR